MILKLLVKNYGNDGLAVHGITKDDAVAQAWEAGDTVNRCIEVNLEASVAVSGLPLAERI